MVLPLIKVASLVIKSASKPFARQMKRTAATNPRFQAVVVGCARAWHSAEGKMSMFVGDRAKEPKQLNVAAAVDLGSELASEGFLLSIAVVLLLLENKRSSNKEKAKNEKVQRRFASLEDQAAKQQATIDSLQAQLDHFMASNPSSASISSSFPNKS